MVVVALAAVLVAGLYEGVSDTVRYGATGAPMGSMMGGRPGVGTLQDALVTLLVVLVLGGTYVVLRVALTDTQPVRLPSSGASSEPSPAVIRDPDASDAPGDRRPDATASPARRLLDLLPEDERRVLEPVVTSPGVTQRDLRDRAGFSKSKVSQTVRSLERRGLLYRERHGRTFRVYPDETVVEA